MRDIRSNRNITWLIYLSHSLSAWGDRMWDFAVGLYMVVLYPESLMLTASLGLATALSVIVFGSLLGSWIDKTTRIKSATVSIIVQNTAVSLGASVIALMFVYRTEIQPVWNGALTIVIYALIIIAAVIAKLASVTSDIAIERDWIVVLTDGDDRKLAKMNAVMRTIDLTTKILAPVAITALMSYWSHVAGAVFILAWNIVSGFAEVYILVAIYKAMPDLSDKFVREDGRNALRRCFSGWRMYMKHPIKWAGIGFSFLYMSVLGLDQITTGYLYSQGMGESLIGVCTALAAITGIIGSIMYPYLRQCAGPVSTFNLGYFINSVCLALCVASIFLPGSPFDPNAILDAFKVPPETNSQVVPAALTIEQLWNLRPNIFVLVGGIVLARFGLWTADLSMSQLLQDRVEERKRGAINGVQNSMNQVMDLTKFILVIFLPLPSMFGYLIIATWVFGCLGWILYYFYSLHAEETKRSHKNDRSIEKDFPSEATPLLVSA